MNQASVCCIGELLIDMYCTDVDVALKDGQNFKKMAGGAPANVAATVARLGGKAFFAGKVGSDSFGKFLIETLNHYEVDTSMVAKDETVPTTIAFVSLTADGERDFQFNRGADKNLQITDLPLDRILKSNIIHFGSATALLDGALKETYFSLLAKARKENKFISFDPNFRQDLWKNNVEEFVQLSREAAAYANFVKVSHEELEIMTGKKDTSGGIAKLHQLGPAIIAVTMGKDGSIISTQENEALIPSKPVTSIDATGAGDAFIGAMLFQIARTLQTGNKPSVNDFSYLQEAVRFANRVGGTVCTKVGSLSALPTMEEVEFD